MRPCSAALAAYLAANDSFVIADLYTFALATGEVLRYSGWTTPLAIPGTAFPAGSLNYDALSYSGFALGPRFGRSKVTTKTGVAPTELDVEILAGAADLIGAFPFAEAVRVGLFDGATIELDRFFAPASPTSSGMLDTSLGAIVWFTGRVADTDVGRSKIQMTVKSLMNLLAIQQMPRRLYQAACTHAFGDAMCGFDRSSLAQTAAALAGSTQSGIHTALSPSPTTLFDQGTILGVTGQNAGLTRTIRQMTGGVAYQLQAWLYPVSVGDTFQFLPGCDHTTATCHNSFNNLARYGGFPYIPPPETAV
jgi:uncharacterized phage protein (TIGR02218 family)